MFIESSLWHSLKYGSTVLYEKYVFESIEKTTDSKRIEKLFKIAGFNGCVMDHPMELILVLYYLVQDWAFNNHKGFKLAIPSR